MTKRDDLLEKIKEYILDEDKIVTIILILKQQQIFLNNKLQVTTTWLASNLKVKVTEAADLLKEFVADHRSKKQNELLATYVLSGLHKNGKLTVALVPENEVVAKRGDFENVESEIIFSVQKSGHLDLSVLSLVDRFDGSSLDETM